MMTAFVGRVVRPSLAVAFVLGLVGLGATSARAFVDESLVCADPSSIVGNFDDETNWVDFEAGNCTELCKKYSQTCVSYVKKNATCARAAATDNAAFELKSACEPLTDATAKKACKAGVKAEREAAKTAIKNDSDSFAQDCADFQSSCVDVCENGIPVT